MHLADEAVYIHDQAPVSGAGARPPPRVSVSARTRSSWRTRPSVTARRNVPNVEGPGSQPPDNRRVRPAQGVTVIDVVSPEQHRVDQRNNLALRVPRPGRSRRSVTDRSTRPSILGLSASVEDNRDHHIRHHRLIVEHDLEPVQFDPCVIMQYPSDLLTHRAPTAHRVVKKAWSGSGGHLDSGPDGTLHKRGGFGLSPKRHPARIGDAAGLLLMERSDRIDARAKISRRLAEGEGKPGRNPRFLGFRAPDQPSITGSWPLPQIRRSNAGT